MVRYVLTFSALAFLAHQQGYAANLPLPTYDPSQTECMLDHGDTISSLLHEIDMVDNALPNVPPEEARYLEAESKGALGVAQEDAAKGTSFDPVTDKRLESLYARPLYPIWEFRPVLEKTRKALEQVMKPTMGLQTYNNPDAEILVREMRASAHIAAYSRAAERLIQRLKAAPIMTTAQYDRLEYDSGIMPLRFAYVMRCRLAKIMGRQTVTALPAK